ncbi:MAG TPA: nicotinate (nicotinamide) nucleotide adenylyltransferase, partial [Candidatus Eisenbacteria bacterium]|nr:nicotinate (nicotinamide) nucleotide adenylyltransferase [Candidatus Eisenbacteria bacterium]
MRSDARRRIGLFGGTFDPPHLGHLALAEAARDRLRLDEVRFVPAGRPPHKSRARITSTALRVAMVRLAVRRNRAFTVSTLEAHRGGPSFTVETLRRVAEAEPGARLYLLMGADSLGDFATWREPEAIVRLATLAVAERP